jgi:hypothetical protein
MLTTFFAGHRIDFPVRMPRDFSVRKISLLRAGITLIHMKKTRVSRSFGEDPEALCFFGSGQSVFLGWPVIFLPAQKKTTHNPLNRL